MPRTFEHGQIVVTRSVSNEMSKNGEFSMFVFDSLSRHLNGDWGDICEDDKNANDRACDNDDDRIFSSYVFKDYKIWIITEYDRSATTILFPSDY